MRYSRERCWLNVKFAFAALNIITLLFCTSSQPMEGFLLCLTGDPRILTFLPGPARLLPGSAWWRICGARGACREWGDGEKTQSSLTLLLSDRVCGCTVRLWITKGIMDSFTQGTTFWAGAGGTDGYKKGQNRAAMHTNECNESMIGCLWDSVPPMSLISWYVVNVLERCLMICDTGVFLFFLLPMDIWRKFRSFPVD